MPENIKLLIFYEGDHGMGRDTYLIKDTEIMVAREDRGTEVVRWVYLGNNDRGQETSYPIAAGATMQVLSITKTPSEFPVMFTEYTYDVYGSSGLSNKSYPFSWEASQ